MTHAYSEIYLGNAKDSLAQFLDYGVNTCQIEGQWLVQLFISTGYANQFERGNPAILAGMSGIELAEAVLFKAYGDKEFPQARFHESRSPEYWVGWALAEYQWTSGRRFKDIFAAVTLPEMLCMYPVYHEMDISQFVEEMERRVSQATLSRETKLRRIREFRGLSQSELAKASGVGIRAIQTYEQRIKDIDKAQSNTVYKLSRVLGCDVEDLLENPMR